MDYLAIRTLGLLFFNGRIAFAARWMDFTIMLSERSQTEGQILYDTTYMWNLKTTPPSKLVNITKTSRLTDTEDKLVFTSGERGVGSLNLRLGSKKYNLLHIK